ncbi:MAG TPA: hypothetical protein VLL48_04060 [Longimicrobiales bacterium]|nr:hypothetical protein [Longimicrobiales bacterium]
MSLLGALVPARAAGALVAAERLSAQEAPTPVGEPAWRLGALEAPPEEQFYRVRNPLLLPDGRLVVPDAGSSRIRVFDDRRELLWTAGREGDGPGEFRSVDRVHRYRGDSLAVFDGRLQRLTIIDADGDVGRTIGLGRASGAASIDAGPSGAEGPPVRLFAVGAFPDGSFLVRRGELSVGPGDTTAVRRDRFTYGRMDPEGRPLGDVVSLPDDEQFVWAEGGSRSARPRAFGRTTAVAVGGENTFVADNTAFRVVVLDARGDTVRVLSTPRDPRPVREADRERWRAAELEALGEGLMRRIAEQAVEAMAFPETMPHHGALVLGTDGRVWLEEYRPPHTNSPSTWTVFAPDGGVVGRREFPTGFRLTWVGPDGALGVLQDELGVERVVLYRLPAAG